MSKLTSVKAGLGKQITWKKSGWNKGPFQWTGWDTELPNGNWLRLCIQRGSGYVEVHLFTNNMVELWNADFTEGTPTKAIVAFLRAVIEEAKP